MEIVQLDAISDFKDIKILSPSKDPITISNFKSSKLVSNLKEEIFSRYELSPASYSIRLIYKGKLLNDHSTLQSVTDEDLLTLHCSINEKTEDSNQATSQHNEVRPMGFDR